MVCCLQSCVLSFLPLQYYLHLGYGLPAPQPHQQLLEVHHLDDQLGHLLDMWGTLLGDSHHGHVIHEEECQC